MHCHDHANHGSLPSILAAAVAEAVAEAIAAHMNWDLDSHLGAANALLYVRACVCMNVCVSVYVCV